MADDKQNRNPQEKPLDALVPAPEAAHQAQTTLPATPNQAEERAIADPRVFGGVSWEEVRKAQPPRPINNPDEAVWSDHHTSQMTIVNMTNARWKPVRPIFIPE